ncbi:hypothetical protein MPSEU_000116500 [Mayamaea pseudoterrestris]|nr:hypothetical protein MPSEU_000116500 [Mayamaea pseudoterrestris]
MEQNNALGDYTVIKWNGILPPQLTGTAANRLAQLQAMVDATPHYSPELLKLIQQEKHERIVHLSNMLRQSSHLYAGSDSGLANTKAASQTSIDVQRNYPMHQRPFNYAAPPARQQATSMQNDFATSSQGYHPLSLRQSLAAQMLLEQQQNVRLVNESFGQHSRSPARDYSSRPIIQMNSSRYEYQERAGDHLQVDYSAPAISDNKLDSRAAASTTAFLPIAPAAHKRPRDSMSMNVNAAAPTAAPTASAAASTSSSAQFQKRRYRTETFPRKLYRMIQTARLDGQQHLIHFTEDGTAINMPSPRELTEQVFPKYFRHSNYASFQRQLSMYGWTRKLFGRNKGSYSHPLFIEGRPDLLDQMQRISELEAAASANDASGAINDMEESKQS